MKKLSVGLLAAVVIALATAPADAAKKKKSSAKKGKAEVSKSEPIYSPLGGSAASSAIWPEQSHRVPAVAAGTNEFRKGRPGIVPGLFLRVATTGNGGTISGLLIAGLFGFLSLFGET